LAEQDGGVPVRVHADSPLSSHALLVHMQPPIRSPVSIEQATARATIREHNERTGVSSGSR
jgi:hypothetical protein